MLFLEKFGSGPQTPILITPSATLNTIGNAHVRTMQPYENRMSLQDDELTGWQLPDLKSQFGSRYISFYAIYALNLLVNVGAL